MTTMIDIRKALSLYLVLCWLTSILGFYLFNAEFNLVLLVSVIFLFAISIALTNVTSPVFFLLISTSVFLLSRPILSTIGIGDYTKADWFIEEKLTHDGLQTTNTILLCITLGYGLAMTLFCNTTPIPHYSVEKSHSTTPLAFRTALPIILYCISGLAYILNSYYIYQSISANGYESLYTTTTSATPLGIKSAAGLFIPMFYYCALYIKQLRGNALFYFASILIISIGLLKGSRGEFVTFFLTTVALFFRHTKKSNMYQLTMLSSLFLLLFFVSEVVSSYRSDTSFEKIINNNNPLLWFVYGQGTSFISLYQSVVYSDFFNSHSQSLIFLFAQPIITANSLLGNSLDIVNISLSNAISSLSNHEMYEQGFGMGGSVFAELYIAGGMLGVFIGAFSLMSAMILTTKLSAHSNAIAFIFYSSLPAVLFIPRETLFYFAPALLKAIVILFIMNIVNSNNKVAH